MTLFVVRPVLRFLKYVHSGYMVTNLEHRKQPKHIFVFKKKMPIIDDALIK